MLSVVVVGVDTYGSENNWRLVVEDVIQWYVLWFLDIFYENAKEMEVYIVYFTFKLGLR